jgi:hypothetical protein
MAKGPWSEITEFPPEEEPQAKAPGESASTRYIVDLQTPKWWKPWQRKIKVRVWSAHTGKYQTMAYFLNFNAAMNYAEALAHGIARQMDMTIQEAGGER